MERAKGARSSRCTGFASVSMLEPHINGHYSLVTLLFCCLSFSSPRLGSLFCTLPLLHECAGQRGCQNLTTLACLLTRIARRDCPSCILLTAWHACVGTTPCRSQELLVPVSVIVPASTFERHMSEALRIREAMNNDSSNSIIQKICCCSSSSRKCFHYMQNLWFPCRSLTSLM